MHPFLWFWMDQLQKEMTIIWVRNIQKFISLFKEVEQKCFFFLVALIQTLEEYRVVNYFYSLIPIPSDESAESLKTVVLKKFEDDGILQKIKNNLVGFIRKTLYDIHRKLHRLV